MDTSASLGVTGLGVMGRNLARNFARHGYPVAVHNRTVNRTRALIEEFGHEGTFVAAGSAEEFVAALERPRRLVIMVQAGAATDAVVPAFCTALAYYDTLRADRLPAALLQGQRDYFGAHTYRRTDRPGTFHTHWSHPDRPETSG